ncbi:MAG TPA: alpha/beta hydrolase-fold protein [Gemmataceae bacterium]|nr:alpha/beta hydrolase-fold protein [Gemmataceae bacterium]
MEGIWSTAEFAGKTADLYDPPGQDSPRFGVLHLHGVGLHTLRDRPAFTRFFDEFRMACICPHGGRCWWANRICSEFDSAISPERHLLENTLPAFGGRWGLAPPAVGLLGVGMGGQGALRLAFKHPHLFPVVAAIAPSIEYHELYGHGTPIDALYDSKEQCRQDTAPMHVHPSRFPLHQFFCSAPDDPWNRGADRLHEKLSALGVEHDCDLETRAGGFSWRYFNHMAERALRFLNAGLEEQSRRLL